jgi:hypothetical protein
MINAFVVEWSKKNCIGICYRLQAIINGYCSSREPKHLMLGAWGSPSMQTILCCSFMVSSVAMFIAVSCTWYQPWHLHWEGLQPTQTVSCHGFTVLSVAMSCMWYWPWHLCWEGVLANVNHVVLWLWDVICHGVVQLVSAPVPAAGPLCQHELCCCVMHCSVIVVGLGWCPGPWLRHSMVF